MNCPECGHKVSEHNYECCMINLCFCTLTDSIIERDAWRAEAIAAREIFQVLQGHIEYTHKITEDKVNELYPAYLAARVKDGE